MKDKFEYNYTAPQLEERKEIESIRNQYIPKDEFTILFEKLRTLDNKVKNIPVAVSISLGVIGLLLFGTAMSFFLEITEYWYLGIPFSIIGIITMIFAYPSFVFLNKKLKEKYKDEIIEISNKLLNMKGDN